MTSEDDGLDAHVVGGNGVGHWLFFAVMVAIVLYPIGRLLSRIVLSPFWSVPAVIPLVDLLERWVLAFVERPEKQAR